MFSFGQTWPLDEVAINEPDNLVLQLLREMRDNMATKNDVRAVKTELASVKAELKDDIAEVWSEVRCVRADVALDLFTIEKRLGDRISHLNRSVIEYHSSAVGHGMLIT